ncbi:MAG: type II-A CRISPR-associated protein Csn2 [Candidatus Methanomethylophilaceae archaeon]|nr:type II-A CRISPR-associated protein Csn2 [Candidatus Methanomethylophilaceae archaeon]
MDFSEQKVHRMVLENSLSMGWMVGELSNQIKGLNGRFYLSESGRELDMRKKVELIVDPFSLDHNSKEIVSGLHKCISSRLESGDDYLSFREVVSDLLRVLEKVSTDVDSSVSLDDPSSQSLLKIASVGIMDPTDITESISEYARLITSYSEKELVALVNVDLFMSDADYKECLKQIRYLQVPILFIETKAKDDGIPTKLFDADFCELNF